MIGFSIFLILLFSSGSDAFQSYQHRGVQGNAAAKSALFKRQSGTPDRVPSVALRKYDKKLLPLRLGNTVSKDKDVSGPFDPSHGRSKPVERLSNVSSLHFV
jgi:hypothetical protein